MLDVNDLLVDQFGDARVMQVIDDVLATALADDEAEMAKLPELMRHSGRLHPHRIETLTDRAGPLLQPAQDLHTARSRQHPHALGNSPRNLAIESGARRRSGDPVAHPNIR